VLQKIKDRISQIVSYNCPISPCLIHEVVLTVSGMSALFTAFRLALHYHYHRKRGQGVSPTSPPDFVMFGFPYLDTLKIIRREEWNGGKAHFFGDGGRDDLEALVTLLESGHEVAAVFTEFPGNPLLKCPDLKRLSALSEQYGFLLVVDDTISNMLNTDLLHSPDVCVDVVCSSLTKIFSGVGNVMAGSMVLNMNMHTNTGTCGGGSSRSEKCLALQHLLIDEMVGGGDLPTLGHEDAVVLEENSRDFLTRSNLINTNALTLAQWLQCHPAVETVNYPGLSQEGKVMFDGVKREPVTIGSTTHQAGYGCLMSIELKATHDTSVFYDLLDVRKGPSLGTSFTLVCPYTLLAHYTELPWAASFGVEANIIRVSVGLEEIEDLIVVFSKALDGSPITVSEGQGVTMM
jgi:cystathionine gamma-synthase